ncbi:MAG: phosphotransferase [Rhodobacteraceae bacterium]|nr:phosphotransferase [Paracoccaceae bacterium]
MQCIAGRWRGQNYANTPTPKHECWTKQYHASQIDDIPEMNKLIDWLGANIPPDDGQRTLVHGDFRIDNMLFDT